MRKINKIDKFYEDREELEKLKDRLVNRVLFSINVDESSQNTSITIRSPYVIDDLHITHQRRIYHKLRELLEKERCDITSNICKKLKKDLEELRKDIQEDFNLGGNENVKAKSK